MVRCRFAVILTISLFSNAFCVPAVGLRRRRISEDSKNSEISEDVAPIIASTSSSTTVSLSPNNDDDDNDDDDDFGTSSHGTSTGGGGSNLFSLLNLATSLMPASGSGSSGGNTNTVQTESTTQPPASPLWTLKMNILRSILQFATSMMGIASSAFANSSY